ncbi:hypothetical protein [Hyphococcus sp.]|uniref:hypothetical protein n=1 Tax=Hyphococcus sp. TaxID=2038636 RepID=UPI00208D9FD9|nr:MAG: hypothetical protein DHS20C04_27530 [Marinicaulis sp.]
MNAKKLIVGMVWLAALALWIGIGVYYVTAEPELEQWTLAVTIGAIGMEVAFWTTAAVLGLTLFESRKAVFGFLTRPFRRGA